MPVSRGAHVWLGCESRMEWAPPEAWPQRSGGWGAGTVGGPACLTAVSCQHAPTPERLAEPPSCPGVPQPYPTCLPYPHPLRPKNPVWPHSHNATFVLQLQNGETDQGAGLYLSLSLKKNFPPNPTYYHGTFLKASEDYSHIYLPASLSSFQNLRNPLDRAAIDSCAGRTLHNLRRCRSRCRL